MATTSTARCGRQSTRGSSSSSASSSRWRSCSRRTPRRTRRCSPIWRETGRSCAMGGRSTSPRAPRTTTAAVSASTPTTPSSSSGWMDGGETSSDTRASLWRCGWRGWGATRWLAAMPARRWAAARAAGRRRPPLRRRELWRAGASRRAAGELEGRGDPCETRCKQRTPHAACARGRVVGRAPVAGSDVSHIAQRDACTVYSGTYRPISAPRAGGQAPPRRKAERPHR
mmetsp:Transcript_89231/g.253027  ORF Transcript_89231/g.253027 Transcript_89231/m.253027 type:complete len:228 (-) Transcript_89231:111-794(-)